MSSEQAQGADGPSITAARSHTSLTIDELDPTSYTAHRLQHASAKHLHLTSRRCFIGPIPEGWLKSNKSWYRRQLPLSSYSSRTSTFSASSKVSHRRQITGLDGPSAAAIYGHSFPQPDNASDDDRESDRDSDASVKQDTRRSPSAIAAQSPQKEAVDSPSITKADGIRYLDRSRTSLERAPSNPKAQPHLSVPHKKERRPHNRSDGAHSFVTAHETQIHEQTSPPADENSGGQSGASSTGPLTEEASTPVDGTTSTSSLLSHGKPRAGKSTSSEAKSRGQPVKSAMKPQEFQDLVPEEDLNPLQTDVAEPRPNISLSAGLVHFNIPDELAAGETQMKAKYASISRHGSLRHFRRAKLKPGEIVKVEKMLVRVDYTIHELPAEYDENDSLKSESRIIEKWREFVVVCRKGIKDQAEFLLQMYKSRVIPATEQAQVQKSSVHSIPLTRKSTKLNLYSSLDKTIVIWVPWKKGTRTYILRPQSSASSVEWYTFLRDVLGRVRPDALQVNVPDLNVTLQLDNPFEDLERARDAARAGNEDMTALMKTMAVERAVAGSIVKRCMTMLEDSPEWSTVVESWLKHEKMGLAWKRYDRLEWIHGANEQKMYGTLAMQKTHDLELRPKHHYPTHIRNMEEPTPIEGFLVRLTSQTGRDQRFGKNFSKRLYFSTHNQFLCYCRPGKALPPPPPRPPADHRGNPSTPDNGAIPLIYAINPYPLNDRAHLSWLEKTSSAQKKYYDKNAYEEAERRVNTLTQAEGYINLCHVVRIQHVQRQKPSTDHQSLNQEPRAGNDEAINDASGEVNDIMHTDTNRTFELLLHNGLVVRFQAYDQVTRKEWMTRLDRIVEYWKRRIAHDMVLYKEIRRTNLDRLNIDEEMESVLGQSAEKWEVSRSVASPQLFNMCGISCCRSITMSGVLYRKPRIHSTFQRCSVILSHGQLLIFQSTLRKSTGKAIPHIQHERQQVLNLKDCYIYSGLITEGDLLYQNQTFDSNHPGHHVLPRVYLEDSWTSSDEDTTTCFVIWHGKRKSFFMANKEEGEGEGEGSQTRQRLRYVSRLGVTGRSITFKTRSRTERDHWVMNIGMEIERLHQSEDIRVVAKK